jgi:hypothetical protein
MTVEELESLVEDAESELRDLQQQLRAAKIEASPFKPDQIITDRKGEEAKVLRVLVNYGEARPVVVYRKKNGQWGEREYTLYGWDLPEQAA